MQFIIDSDSGDSIKGWLTPDNPSLSPTLIVRVPGREEIAVPANVMRPTLRDLGMHATGMCGFDISAKIVPDLAKCQNVELLEQESRLLVYRRFNPARHIPKKLFLFDASMAPQRRIFEHVSEFFSLSYANSEQNGLETTITLITNPFNKSIFITGRSPLMRFDHLLKEKGHMRAAILREPYEELAERLLFLHFLAKQGVEETLAAYSTGARSLVAFAGNLPFGDLKAMTTAFRAASDEQRRELASPMTKMLGCDLDQPPKRDNVTRALDNLAGLDVVGTREKYATFREMLAGAVGDDILGAGEPATFQSVGALATTLARIGLVTDLIAEDLALYSFVDEAIGEGLDAVDA